MVYLIPFRVNSVLSFILGKSDTKNRIVTISLFKITGYNSDVAFDGNLVHPIIVDRNVVSLDTLIFPRKNKKISFIYFCCEIITPVDYLPVK